MVKAALDAGACTWLIKPFTMAECVRTIRAVHAGSRRLPPKARDLLIEACRRQTKSAEHHPILSRRERQVLEFMAQGLDDKDIATALNLSTRTIHGLARRAYRKLGVHSRDQASLLLGQA